MYEENQQVGRGERKSDVGFGWKVIELQFTLRKKHTWIYQLQIFFYYGEKPNTTKSPHTPLPPPPPQKKKKIKKRAKTSKTASVLK